MNTQIKISILAAMIATLGACSKKSTASDPAASTGVLSTALSVSAASSSVAAGGTTTITVTGGSGTYVTASASYGTLVAASASTFTYTAPSTVTSINEAVTITDTGGLSGTIYITLTGGTTTTTGSTSCSASFTTSVGGTAGNIVLVGGAGGAAAGYLSMFGYIYPLYGSCVISGTTGTVSLNEPFFNSTYSGTISVSGGKINITGTASNSSTVTPATWTASSTTTLSTLAPPTTSSCQGNYTGMIGPNAGTVKMTHDGSGKIAGLMTISGGYYAVTGTCSSTAVSFTNVTTGSTYTGTVTMSGTSTVSMSGSFNYSGTPYTWSLSK